MATGSSRASSPTRDALRILFRNPSAVLALVMVLLLAVTATTGTLLTGAEPTPEQQESIINAGELGDTLDLDVNTWSLQDPGKTDLKDKLKSPFSRSESDESRIYYLGTDHLGRDILAQLWAGSSISLTIGFLAVGISVLLGVSLGGIAGYFGRERVRLPLLAALLSALVGAISFAAEAPRAGAVFLGLSALLLALQAVVAMLGRRIAPVAAFAGALILAGVVFAYNSHVESTTPEGKRLAHARKLAEMSHDVLLMTRDLGHERRNAESGMPGAKDAQWLQHKQLELEVAYRALALAEHELNYNTWLTQIDIDERSAQEGLDRAEHLHKHVDQEILKNPLSGDSPEAKRFQRHQNRLKTADDLKAESSRRAERAAAVRQALPAVVSAVDAVIADARNATVLAEEFDFASTGAALKLLRDTQTALVQVDLALAWADAAVLIAAAGGKAPELAAAPDKAVAEAAKLLEAAKSVAEKAAAELNAIGAETKENKAQRDNLVMVKADADWAAAAAGRVETLAKSLSEIEPNSKVLAELLARPEADAERAKLFQYNYGVKEVAERNPLLPNAENSDLLLNRRAQVRANYLKKYEAEAGTLFDGASGIVKIRTLDGSLRYGSYRMTRHFLTYTILALIVLVTALVMAGAAQKAAIELGRPLKSLFVPTLTVDDLVMRFTEIMMTIPVIFLILAVLALFERDVYIVMGVIGLTSWMGTTRFVRAEILSLREQDFVQAARAVGVGDFRIIWRHLVPNAISPVLVSATIGVAGAVLAESTLSFLGIGAGPDQHTWGKILSNGRAYIADAPWMTWIPGVAILITVLSFNLLGEGLREAFNPKLRGR